MANKKRKPIKEVHQEFFKELQNYFFDSNSFLKSKKTRSNYMDIDLDNSFCHICISSDSVHKELDIRIYINDDKKLFEKLKEKKQLINEKLEFKMDWKDVNEKSSYAILTEHFDVRNHDEWEKIFRFIKEKSEKIYQVIRFFL